MITNDHQGRCTMLLKRPPCVEKGIEVLRTCGAEALRTYYRELPKPDHKVVDRWLVFSNHPLIRHPGTQEHRFELLITELAGGP
jgi:hypothetical protein